MWRVCDGLRRQFARVNEAPVTGCNGGKELVPGLGTQDVFVTDALLVKEIGGLLSVTRDGFRSSSDVHTHVLERRQELRLDNHCLSRVLLSTV